MDIDIKQAITDLMCKAGLTQEDIAASAGCRQENISYHLNSCRKRPRPSYQLVSALINLLKLHADKLQPETRNIET